jgi:PBP1b-binding outer membrane lipoprotein LpoB
MKRSLGILLLTILLAACSPGNSNKPVTEQQRATLQKAEQVDSAVQQQAEQQRQEAEKQAQ